MKAETQTQRAILEAVNASGRAVLWRNNVGFDRENRTRYGLCVGSSDLIGLTSSGRFVALEVKTAIGKPSREQTLYLALVAKLGGIARIVRSVEDALTAISETDNDN